MTSTGQKMRYKYLPYQQREGLKFVWDHIDGSGPIHYDGSMLFIRTDSSRDFEFLDHVSKRTIKDLVRHKLISVRRAAPWEDEKIFLTPLGSEWGSYPLNSQK